MAHDNLYHEGEPEIQARAGVVDAARTTAAAIQDRIPPGAAHFIAEQAMAVLGSLDADGNIWASVLFGSPGFLQATDDRSLRLQPTMCHSAPLRGSSCCSERCLQSLPRSKA